jgi:hypothetical protein
MTIRTSIHLSLIATLIGLTTTGCRKPSTSSPPAGTAILCITLAPDGGSLFVSHGPCSYAGGGYRGNEGGGIDPRFNTCDATFKADKDACEEIKDPKARGKCMGKAYGKFVQCLFDQVYGQ